MAKSFKLQMNPTFKATVKVPRVGGDPLTVGFTFRALDRRGLAKVFDKWKQENIALIDEAKEAAEHGNEFTLEQWADREIDLQVKQVKDITVGWGFDDEFNDENIEALVSTSVSVTDAILEQYNEAYTRARTGN
ncbi:MAG: tail assembly chaperone [Caudoviricetes sp.]|nr:MAG: tail assembly chaperone [Caudoviricetes sp.]